MRVFLCLYAAAVFCWILEHCTARAKKSLSCLCEILKGSKSYSCQVRGFAEELEIAQSCPLKAWRVKHIVLLERKGMAWGKQKDGDDGYMARVTNVNLSHVFCAASEGVNLLGKRFDYIRVYLSHIYVYI